ncbi:5,10-methenyltetrahydrofolate synthetase (5-formyltetrahydrofolate cyclo-ligase) isoform X1 [Chiloscyllium plagiosum]|uniref:5,10-methenyltetrahydrofolate synthetase (5-formyltetrahydrofolate cyclo-ligase) isoform X1 n=2 Tax=Chiloscyllium plagiosum TaxID=36176 RepID=UPI001CB8706C|nr:5,10-methenyltetrahydrofolate synthetase (5-formyltetrahydrofolate cyclo-ligase) isoform X1 [Chiloscyllium plagiosum]
MEAGGAPLAPSPGNMAALRAAKKALRLEMKRKVAALSDAEKRRQTEAVSRRLIAHPKYKNCQRIAVFLSMSDEIQTEDIIKDVFQCGKECFIPRYKSGTNHMDMVKLGSAEEILHLSLTSWNIRQPAEDGLQEEALTSGGLDLILMPGLGFDKFGNRLGRGKGYYDTYLERCWQHPKGRPYTIALAFKEQICDHVPVVETDKQIDEVLYDSS